MSHDDYEDSPWNFVSVNPAVNDTGSASIGQAINPHEVNTLDLSKSFYENGGSSLSAISTLLTLKQQGHEVSVEDFLRLDKISALNEPTLTATMTELSNNFSFRRKPLAEVSAEAAQNLITDCFVQKGDLEKSAKLAREDFKPVVRTAWPKLLKYSFAMLNVKDELVGVATIADAYDMSDLTAGGCHPYVQDVFTYLDVLTARVTDRLPAVSQPGVLLTKFLIGTSLTCSPTENVYLMYLMETEIHKCGQDHQFKSSIAQNTNPLTQQLADFFDCQRLLTDQPTFYRNGSGNQPFTEIPESTVVTVDLKGY